MACRERVCLGASNAVENRVTNRRQENELIVKTIYHTIIISPTMDFKMTFKNILTRRQWSYERPTSEQTMARGSPAIAITLILMMIVSTCLVAPTQADSSSIDDIEVLHTAVNPENNKTYHLSYHHLLGKMLHSKHARLTVI